MRGRAEARGGGSVVLLRKTQVGGESFWLIEFRLHGNYEFVRIALSTAVFIALKIILFSLKILHSLKPLELPEFL